MAQIDVELYKIDEIVLQEIDASFYIFAVI